MAFQEIERKFLVAGDFRGEVSGASRIIQGFLNSGKILPPVDVEWWHGQGAFWLLWFFFI